MKVEKAFCLFEQSGTFKNAFKAIGVDAYDYDVLNDFGETDFQIDIFDQIEKAYSGAVSIFDEMQGGDSHGVFPMHVLLEDEYFHKENVVQELFYLQRQKENRNNNRTQQKLFFVSRKIIAAFPDRKREKNFSYCRKPVFVGIFLVQKQTFRPFFD